MLYKSGNSWRAKISSFLLSALTCIAHPEINPQIISHAVPRAGTGCGGSRYDALTLRLCLEIGDDAASNTLKEATISTH